MISHYSAEELEDALASLVNAAENIREPSRWCQGALARNEGYERVKPGSEEAIQWCALGSMMKAIDDTEGVVNVMELQVILNEVLRDSGSGMLLPLYNDALTTSHSDMIALFDNAIECIQEELMRKTDPLLEAMSSAELDELVSNFKAARENIEEPSRWCKGSFAKNINQEECEVDSEEAVAWCSLGTLGKVLGMNEDLHLHVKVLTSAMPSSDFAGIGSWNDFVDTSHGDVLDLYDSVICRIESELSVR